MINLAVLATRATDWTRETWAERLVACADTLFIHQLISRDQWLAVLDALEDAQAQAAQPIGDSDQFGPFADLGFREFPA